MPFGRQSPMRSKFLFIYQRAIAIRAAGQTEPAAALAAALNAAGLRTGNGTPYVGGRGTYTLI